MARETTDPASDAGFSAQTCGPIPMAIGPVGLTMRGMRHPTSYAVTWRDGDARFVGDARLEARALRLEGRDAGGCEGLRTIGYDDISRIDVSRTNGTRGIVLEIVGDDRVVIMSLDRPGSLGELTEQLRNLADSPHE